MNTHTPTAQGHSFLACFPVMHISVPVTRPICTPAHPHAERAIHSMPVPQLIAAKDGVMLGMSSQLLTPPPILSQPLPSVLHAETTVTITSMYVNTHTCTLTRSGVPVCYACTPPTVRCVRLQGVSCTLSGLSGFLSPTLTAIIHNVLEMPVPSPQLTSIFFCVCV